MITAEEALDRIMITKQELADLLGVSLLTIHRRIKDETIPHVNLGKSVRIPRSYYKKYI